MDFIPVNELVRNSVIFLHIRGITFEITDEGRVLKEVSEAFEGAYTIPHTTVRHLKSIPLLFTEYNFHKLTASIEAVPANPGQLPVKLHPGQGPALTKASYMGEGREACGLFGCI